MKDIISQVKSPFSDEMVKKLIKKYISWNEDFLGFCRRINNVDFFENVRNPFIEDINDELNNKIKKSNLWNNVLSDKNYLKKEDGKKTELYRIYLNLKGNDKAKFIDEYVKKCETQNKGYKFKYFTKDGRDDEIIILTDLNNLKTEITIIEQIIKKMELGKLPPLVGVYKKDIGIAEEYKEPIYSYTEVRLDMIPKAITKYIFDNSLEFIEYCNTRQVKLISDISKILKNYKENILLGQIGYGMHIVVVKELIEPLRQYMLDNSKKALPEMILNFRIACKLHGISEQGVFSLETEQKVLENFFCEEISLVELQNELEKLTKQEKRTSQKKDETKMLRNVYKTELENIETN